MKKIVIAVLLSAFVATPAFAASSKSSVGVNYGFDLNGVLGIQGEFDISSMVNKQPVSIQPFFKMASETVAFAKAETTAFGVAGIYDFSAIAKLDKKIQPYAGLGLVRETAKVTTTFPGFASISASASSINLYYTFGVKYSLTPQVSADVNFNKVGGLTLGANFNF
jgi:opacity protein-like surface antigen